MADVEFKATGPLFDGSGPAAVRRAARTGVAKLAQYGQDFARNVLQPGHGVKTGLLRSAIRGYPTSDLSGQVAVDQPPVNYAAAIEFGWNDGYKGLRGSFAGYHYMDLASQAVQRADADAIVGPVIVSELS